MEFAAHGKLVMMSSRQGRRGRGGKPSLERIKTADPMLRAFLTVEPDLVMARAAEVDRLVRTTGPMPLAGVPVAVKDNICTRHLEPHAAPRSSQILCLPTMQRPLSAWKMPVR